jgi:hypothetical protein
MRYAGLIAAVVLGLACGPDPNAKLPGLEVTVSGGAGGSGGIVGSGGTTEGSGGITTTVKGGAGGTSPFGSGGKVGSGGVTGSGGITGRGGATTGKGGTAGTTLTGAGGTSIGGRTGTGGAGARDGGGTGGVGARDGGTGGAGARDGGGGARTEAGVPDVPGTDDVGTSTAACADATAITGSVTFNTTKAFCFVTCDNTTNGWGCDSFTEKTRTVTVNGTAVTCGGTMPPKKTPGGYYYFEIGPGGEIWDAIHFSGPAVASCPAPPGGFSP